MSRDNIRQLAVRATTIGDLLALGRDIWGDRRMTGLAHVAVAAEVVAAKLAREARAELEGRDPDWAGVTRALGNLELSVPRWADDLGLDMAECLAVAVESQRAYVREHA